MRTNQPKAQAKHYFGACTQTPQLSPLRTYLALPHANPQLTLFYDAMKRWSWLQPPYTQLLADNLSYDTHTKLGEYSVFIRRAIPSVALACEALAARNKDAYLEYVMCLTKAFHLHNMGILRREKGELRLNRYDAGITLVTNLMTFPLPRKAEHVHLHPDYIAPNSPLERQMGSSLADIVWDIFQQMRVDGRNDQVDFLLGQTIRIADPESRHTQGAVSGITDAFVQVYRRMTPDEKISIYASRFYTQCETARTFFDKCIQEIEINDLLMGVQERHAARHNGLHTAYVPR